MHADEARLDACRVVHFTLAETVLGYLEGCPTDSTNGDGAFETATADLPTSVNVQQLQVAKRNNRKGTYASSKAGMPIEAYQAIARYIWAIAGSSRITVNSALVTSRGAAHAMLQPYYTYLRAK